MPGRAEVLRCLACADGGILGWRLAGVLVDPRPGNEGAINSRGAPPKHRPIQGYPGFMSTASPSNGEGQPDVEREARRAARSEQRAEAAQRPGVMIPSRRKRLPLEAPLMRLVATAGIIGIGVVIAAIMASQDSSGWLIGLVVSIVSVALAAILWSSQRL